MLLAIDAGNTNVVFAVYEQHRQLAQWRISTSPTRTADEYAVWLTHLMELAGIEPVDISAAIIASVVPAVTFNVERLARDHFNTEPLVVGRPEVDLGIKVLMDNPAEVGGDRLVDAVAARTRYQAPLIVIDFGTATTFNVVDADGNYCGGAIAPGINLSVDALYQATALLPRIEVEKPPRVIGKSTVAAMKSGIYFGYVGLIEGMITRIQQEFGAKLRVIATGGLAPLFAEATGMIDETNGELTLLGLVDVYERSKAK